MSVNTNSGHVPTAMPAYLVVPRTPVGLGVATSLLLVAVIITDVLSLASGGYLYGLLHRLPRPAALPVTTAGVEKGQFLYDAVGILQTLFYLVTGIVYVCWLYRLRDNAEVLAPGTHRLRRGWTGWGWIIPVVSLWYPRRITLDIWKASRPATPDAATGGGHRLINLWWGFWLAEGLLALVGGAVYDKAGSIGGTNDGIGLLILSDVVDIICAVLAIRLVRTLTHMQHTTLLSRSTIATTAY